ncbi:MAG: FtsQ-type POTRA domain-containing protein [Ruthenibacterium lactatiformans]
MSRRAAGLRRQPDRRGFRPTGGENLFGFNTAEAQQAIAAALPYLESVEIKRRLPDTVVITATPAVETYTVESAAGWAVLSQSYKVLRVDAEAPAGLCASTARRPTRPRRASR